MRLFVDASAWIALFDADDKYNRTASAGLSTIRDQVQLVTSDYVLDETLTYLLYDCGKLVAVKCGKWIQNARFIDILRIDEAIWQEAWKMFRAYDDKAWAFTDCTSFVLMQQTKLYRAFTFDQHFAQAGFQLWPGDDLSAAS